MIPELEHLRDDEIEALRKGPLLVSILIAGTDGNIDKNEVKQAISVAHSKKTRAREGLIEFYKKVARDFENELHLLIKELPKTAVESNPIIIRYLKKLNRIIVKLDKSFAINYYGSLKDMAKKVAEASGGIMGYLIVSYEEAKLLELNMIKDPSK